MSENTTTTTATAIAIPTTPKTPTADDESKDKALTSAAYSSVVKVFAVDTTPNFASTLQYQA
jgi:hypothetical protein